MFRAKEDWLLEDTHPSSVARNFDCLGSFYWVFTGFFFPSVCVCVCVCLSEKPCVEDSYFLLPSTLTGPELGFSIDFPC